MVMNYFTEFRHSPSSPEARDEPQRLVPNEHGKSKQRGIKKVVPKRRGAMANHYSKRAQKDVDDEGKMGEQK